MDSAGLDTIEATDAWRRELRQHGIAFVQADDLAKQYRSQLKPVSQTIKETRENVIGLLTSRGVPKCEIGELGASLKVVRRPAKKAPTRAKIRERCVSFFAGSALSLDSGDAEGAGEALFQHLFKPDVTEAVFLRRGKIGGGRVSAAELEADDIPDDGDAPEDEDD